VKPTKKPTRKKSDRKPGRAVASFLWRHRARFAPLYLWLGLLAGGPALGGLAPGWWWAPVLVCTLVAAAVFFAGDRLSGAWSGVVGFLVPTSMDDGRRGVLDRPVERAYLSLLLLGMGTWVSLLADHGVTRWLFWAGVVGLVGFGAPWWWHRRIRRTGRLNRYARRWPQVAEQVTAFEGSRVLPEGVKTLGGRGKAVELTVALKSGKTVHDVGIYGGKVASVFDLRSGAITIAPGRTARQVQVRIVPRDPWAKEITHPFVEDPPTEPVRLADSNRFHMGVLDDGELVSYELFHTLVFGQTGSGKSSFIESLLIYLFSCEDAVVVGSDLAGGATLGVWEPLLAAPLASDVESSLALIVQLRELMDYRLGVLNQRKRAAGGAADDTLEPSPEFPAVVVLLDEWPTLVSEGPADILKIIAVLAKQGRKINLWLILAAQNASAEDVGNTGLRAQLRSMIGFRLDDRQDKTAWGSKRNEGWSSLGLPNGVFLLSDDQHLVPRQSKGFFVRKQERARFIAERTGRVTRPDPGTLAILRGEPTPLPGVVDAEVVAVEHDEPERIEERRPHLSVVPDVPRGGPVARATVAELVAAQLSEATQPMSPVALAESTGKPIDSVNKALRKLAADGRADRAGHGQWIAKGN
jgi:S-DNA-T family DNA segregation ATPase FtsK/SpoIIIE